MIRRDRFLDYVDRFAAARVLVIGPAVAERDVNRYAWLWPDAQGNAANGHRLEWDQAE